MISDLHLIWHRGLECTGTLIGPKHVVTAAHCVYDINDSHQYVASINFAPGQNGNRQPFGQLDWSSVRVLSQFTSQVGLHGSSNIKLLS